METIESRLAEFSALRSIHPTSIICYVSLIHHIVSNPVSRQGFHSHSPLILLFVGFITVIADFPMILDISCSK